MEHAIAIPDALLAEDASLERGRVNRQRIEELVGEYDAVDGLRQGIVNFHRRVVPLRERRRHLTAAGAQLDHGELGRLAQGAEQLANARGHQDAEDGLKLLGGEEVAVLAERIARATVVAVLAMIERHLHEAAEGNRPLAANLSGKQLAGRGHERASRLCGVWRNISTR